VVSNGFNLWDEWFSHQSLVIIRPGVMIIFLWGLKPPNTQQLLHKSWFASKFEPKKGTKKQVDW
jgi:hypothetical protein